MRRLLPTFAGVWVCELAYGLTRSVWFVLALFLLPGIPTLQRAIRERSFPFRLAPFPWLPCFGLSLLSVAIFGVASSCACLLGAAQFDPTFASLMAQLPQPGPMEAPEVVIAHIPHAIALVLFIASVILGPTLYALLFLPGTIAWQRTTASPAVSGLVLVGALGPLALTGFWGKISLAAFLPGYLITLFALGCIAGVLLRGTRNPLIPAALLGSFLAQSEGVWLYLFPTPEYPVGGRFGLCSALLWGLVGRLILTWVRRDKAGATKIRPI
jgi:hypothetical protein